jgi:hypothetical protein
MTAADHRAAALLLRRVAEAESTAGLRAALHEIADHHEAASLAVPTVAADLTDCRIHLPDPLSFP